ncbi:MAG TPA: hypothetical protein VKB26_09115 [Candidatus Acidoferrales bacterium]|nr:hypothetical protein [Candidatus Acidoferrales bacterium]
MSRIQKAGAGLLALMCLSLLLLELAHFRHYAHFSPLGLHADISVVKSDDVLGVQGIAEIYRARLTNYGIFPSSVRVCSERVNGIPATEVNYIVERWDHKSERWRFVPEWDSYGYRLFCRPAFEVTEQHLVRQRLWPGQSLYVGERIPGQLGGFHLGDDGRFTILLNADGDKTKTISTSVFRVNQVPSRFVTAPF